MNYCIKVHFGQFTLEFMWFVVPGHYGCLRAFKHKSFFVEGILKSEFMKHVYSIKYMSQMYHLEFGVAFTMFFIAPLTLSRYHKLTVTKTLPSRFTEKSISLNPALLECLSVWRMVTKKTQFGSFCVLNLILTSFLKKHRHRRNVTSHHSLSHFSLLITPITSLFQLL